MKGFERKSYWMERVDVEKKYGFWECNLNSVWFIF